MAEGVGPSPSLSPERCRRDTRDKVDHSLETVQATVVFDECLTVPTDL